MNTNPPLADQLYGFHWIMWDISESLKNNEDAENAEKISAISPPGGGSAPWRKAGIHFHLIDNVFLFFFSFVSFVIQNSLNH